MASSAATVPRPILRPFFILDGMVIVAATALGLSLAWTWQSALADELALFNGGPWPTGRRTRLAGYALSALIPATFTILALRARRPRPRLWLLARRPGTVACLSAALALGAQVLSLPMDQHTMGGYRSPLLMAAFYWPSAVWAAVLASWVLLAISRRWRSRGDWVDRAGMLIGVGWLALLPFLMLVDAGFG